MKKRFLLFLLALTLLLPSVLAEPAPSDNALLYLAFDEGQGTVVQDRSGNLTDADIEYQYLAPAFTVPMEPQWRKIGVAGGSLLFDGCSTCISYAPEEITVSGNALTISVWIAPRAFEWDDPNAAEEGRAHLTALVGQYYKEGRQGFLLGYQRFGRLCFEVGVGDAWHTLWADDERLTRNAWNHVAAVFNGDKGRMTLYLNGHEAASLDIPQGSAIAPAANERLFIGKNAYGEQIGAGYYQMFAGLMDEIKLYGLALSDAEIAALSGQDIQDIPYAEIGLENILTKDMYKTQYHGGPYQHWMNEPHAPVYYNGMYHLFFQSNSVGTYRNLPFCPRNLRDGVIMGKEKRHTSRVPSTI